ncbi:hypothetical protein [uncultured Cytophaga sp.]|uniref:hypothetical protein n=1 Tax=uncultured Cytophaga sp. TaxID=160238 RepID=UPI00260EC23A|nr:hypothetical protein [uncultured Cytophaga sp.]
MSKSIKFPFIIFCVLMILMVSSCKKNKDEAPQPAAFAYSNAKLNQRWMVTNSNRTNGAPVSTLIAIEFVNNAFVLYFPNDSIVTGVYATMGSDLIILGSYGTLKVNTLSDSNFGFELIVNGSKSIFTSAKATQAIADSDMTNKICKTWKLVEYTIAGMKESPQNSEVTFNKFGTYLTKDVEYGIADIASNTWMWSNTDENLICYGAWDGGNISSCDGLGQVSIEISADGKSAIMEEMDEDFGSITYKLELK